MIVPQVRQKIVQWINEAVAAGARLARACGLIGLSARTLQRWHQGDEMATDQRPQTHNTPSHKLSEDERQAVLAVLNSAEFGHLPPSQIVPRLADQGRYLASESTMYRVLKQANQLAHRRLERAPQKRSKPRALAAYAPNQIYSWDITYLPTTVTGAYFYLYLYLDIFSRKIVGWQVYENESSAQAADLLRDICERENINKNALTVHSDNGAPMKGSTLRATMEALGVAASFSRPSVSNDNPFSESLFKTLKYRPEAPVKAFDNLTQARAWAQSLVDWYNFEHRHSAVQFVTPIERHNGQDVALLARRKMVYETAKLQHPERWTGNTRAWTWVDVVHLNPEKNSTTEKAIQHNNQNIKKAA